VENPLIIEVPKRWLATFTMPMDWGKLACPGRVTIEDGHMDAAAIVVVGWVVFSEARVTHEYVVGTVTQMQVDGRIEDALSH